MSGSSLDARIIQALSAGQTEIDTEVSLNDLTADAIIRKSDHVILVEVKTGDARFPLPSSTHSQMKQFVAEAREKYQQRIVPVVVTNYRVFPEMKDELEKDGIQVLSVDGSVSEIARQILRADDVEGPAPVSAGPMVV